MRSSIRSKYWKPVSVSRSGRPILNESETEILIQDNIGLYQDIVKLVDNQNGKVYLTDKRLIYIDRDSDGGGGGGVSGKTNHPNIYIDLLDIENIELYAGFLKSSAKVIITMKEIEKINRESKNDKLISENLRKDSFVESLYSTPKIIDHDINWACPICYFSNNLTNEQIKKIVNSSTGKLEDDKLSPKCETCGVKAPIELINDLIKSDTIYLDNLIPNVVSKDGFHCPKCTFINHPSLNYCEMCGTRLLSSNLPPSVLQSSYKAIKEGRLNNGGDNNDNDTNDNNNDNNDNDDNDNDDDDEEGLEFLSEDYSKEDELNPRIIKLSFRKNGSKRFYDKLLNAIEICKWENSKFQNNINKGGIKLNRDEVNRTKSSRELSDKIEERQLRNEVSAPSLIMGIHGLETSNFIKSEEDFQLLNNSVQDLENLMSKAKELIKLSESYQKVLINSPSNFKNINKNLDILKNSKTSIKILDNIITKNDFMKSYSTSKNTKTLWNLKNNSNSDKSNKSGLPILYIEELARQIYEFLTDENILDKNNGLITLYELFIIYNRARGINLISPLELYDAVLKFEDLKLNMKLIKIEINNNDSFYILSKGDVSSNSISQKIVNFLKQVSEDSQSKKQKSKSKVDYGQSILTIQSQPNLKMNYLILSSLLTSLCNKGLILVDHRIQGDFYYFDEMSQFDWDADYFNQVDSESESESVGAYEEEPIESQPDPHPEPEPESESETHTHTHTEPLLQNEEFFKYTQNNYISDTLKELQDLKF